MIGSALCSTLKPPLSGFGGEHKGGEGTSGWHLSPSTTSDKHIPSRFVDGDDLTYAKAPPPKCLNWSSRPSNANGFKN